MGELYEISHLNVENYASHGPNLITTKIVLHSADLMFDKLVFDSVEYDDIEISLNRRNY